MDLPRERFCNGTFRYEIRKNVYFEAKSYLDLFLRLSMAISEDNHGAL